VAVLKSFSIVGLKLWFYSNDHEPPHFHAKRKGEWEVKVKFLEDSSQMFEVIWSGKKTQMSKSDRDNLVAMVEKHRSDILDELNKKEAHQ
jgi:hypothetical protein